MKKLLKYKHRLMVCAVALTCCLFTSAGAEGLAESNIGVGLKNLLNDIGTFVLVIGPLGCGAAAAAFLLCRSAADETDGKMWTKRIKNAVICAVGIGLVGGVIKLISSYFAA